MSEKRVEIAAHEAVVIDKFFGPLVMCEIRITVDLARGEWVISRRLGTDWEVAARIGGQNTL